MAGVPAPLLQQPEEHLPAAKRRKQQDREDLLQLQDEYTLLRKVKKGKMSASEVRGTGAFEGRD